MAIAIQATMLHRDSSSLPSLRKHCAVAAPQPAPSRVLDLLLPAGAPIFVMSQKPHAYLTYGTCVAAKVSRSILLYEIEVALLARVSNAGNTDRRTHRTPCKTRWLLLWSCTTYFESTLPSVRCLPYNCSPTHIHSLEVAAATCGQTLATFPGKLNRSAKLTFL